MDDAELTPIIAGKKKELQKLKASVLSQVGQESRDKSSMYTTLAELEEKESLEETWLKDKLEKEMGT